MTDMSKPTDIRYYNIPNWTIEQHYHASFSIYFLTTGIFFDLICRRWHCCRRRRRCRGCCCCRAYYINKHWFSYSLNKIPLNWIDVWICFHMFCCIARSAYLLKIYTKYILQSLCGIGQHNHICHNRICKTL